MQETPFLTGLKAFWRLLWQLGCRDIQTRYKGSVLGLLWSLINPVLTVVLYTFLFSVVFHTQWEEDFGPKDIKALASTSSSHGQYALILFTGLMLHSFLADIIQRAGQVITQQANLVKKVVFPLHVLPAVVVFASLFQITVSAIVLLLALVVSGQTAYVSWLSLPLLILPLVILGLGVAWLLGALGVFLRDLNQLMGWLVTALLFSAPILYPLKTVSQKMGTYLYLNPLTYMVEDWRHVIYGGNWPNWGQWFTYLSFSLVLAVFGYAVFGKMKKGFADVL
jgi:lipopolysaccharide transport system permease protein